MYGVYHTVSECIILYQSVSHCIKVYHTVSKCIIFESIQMIDKYYISDS